LVQPIFAIDIGWTNKAVRLYQEIAHQIELLISEGRLEPGDRLPPERALAGSFKVSRNCVREALRALAEKKLVESRQGDGTYVRDDAASDLARTFAEAFSAQRERIAEIFELRRAVEPGIAALAAEKATPRDIARLKAVGLRPGARARGRPRRSRAGRRLPQGPGPRPPTTGWSVRS